MATFECRRCGYKQDTLWEENCPACRGWYRCIRKGFDKPKKIITAADAVDVVIKRKPTGVAAFDDVLSGGLAKGHVVLFGGPKGSGKTTLMTQVLNSYTSKYDCVGLLASAEEYSRYVLANINRIGALNDQVQVMGVAETGGDVQAVLERCKEAHVRLAVIDSLQAFGYDDMTPSAQRDQRVAHEVNEHCKQSNMIAVLMNHMSKSLEMTGGTRVGHDVDAELEIHMYNEKDDGRASKNFTDEDLERIKFKDVRTLIVGKNRGGEMGRKVFWLCTATGLVPLDPRPAPQPKKPAEAKTTLKLVTEEETTT